MTRLQFLRENKAWAERILATPQDQLPGTLTHEKAGKVLEETEDELLDYLALQVTPTGLKLVHAERAEA